MKELEDGNITNKIIEQEAFGRKNNLAKEFYEEPIKIYSNKLGVVNVYDSDLPDNYLERQQEYIQQYNRFDVNGIPITVIVNDRGLIVDVHKMYTDEELKHNKVARKLIELHKEDTTVEFGANTEYKVGDKFIK